MVVASEGEEGGESATQMAQYSEAMIGYFQRDTRIGLILFPKIERELQNPCMVGTASLHGFEREKLRDEEKSTKQSVAFGEEYLGEFRRRHVAGRKD